MSAFITADFVDLKQKAGSRKPLVFPAVVRKKASLNSVIKREKNATTRVIRAFIEESHAMAIFGSPLT